MNSNLHTSSVYDSMAQKKVRIEVEKSLCSDQQSDKDSSVVESEVKNERFSCNRPMKQIQDVKRLMLTGKKDSSTKKRGILGSATLVLKSGVFECRLQPIFFAAVLVSTLGNYSLKTDLRTLYLCLNYAAAAVSIVFGSTGYSHLCCVGYRSALKVKCIW
nr:zinc finger, RING/FYVE/PHD-type, acyl-CoA N-acyltransferase, Jas TPL-binding domain protein [Tanacetum cinerariifolium]